MSSTTINLLPEVRLNKLRTQALRRTATTVSILVWLVSGSLVVALVIYTGGQKLAEVRLDSQISDNASKIAAQHDLEQAAATDQSHLASSATLIKNRILASRVFKQLTLALPSDVTLDSFSLDPTYSAKISGKAPSYAEVGRLAAALEAYNVTFGGPGFDKTQAKALFKNVDFQGATLESSKNISYTMTFTVDQQVVATPEASNG